MPNSASKVPGVSPGLSRGTPLRECAVATCAAALMISLISLAGCGTGGQTSGSPSSSPSPSAHAQTTSAVADFAANFAGVYRFIVGHPGHDGQLAIFLNNDFSAEIGGEVIITGTLLPVEATGSWVVSGDEVAINVAELNGKPVQKPLTVRLWFKDGFVIEAKSNDQAIDMSQYQFTIGSGDHRPAVWALNAKLAAIPWLHFSDPGTGPGTDVYGEHTRQTVVAFQKARGLQATGVVDPVMWLALDDPRPVAEWVPTVSSGVRVTLIPTRAPPTMTPAPLPTPTLAAIATPEPIATSQPVPAEPKIDSAGAPVQSSLPGGDKVLYLSFDDGPSQYTKPLLDLLDKYNAKATFFNIGQSAARFPDIVQEVVRRGHYVGNHTWDHNSVEGDDEAQFKDELDRTAEVLIPNGGLASPGSSRRCFRPPYGATDQGTYKYANDLGYRVVIWDVDPQDWRRPGAEQIAQHVIFHARPGALVLSHDGGGDRSQTLAAYETILSTLSQQGYRFESPCP